MILLYFVLLLYSFCRSFFFFFGVYFQSVVCYMIPILYFVISFVWVHDFVRVIRIFYEGSTPVLDVDERLHASALRMQRRTLRLRRGAFEGRGRRQCWVSKRTWTTTCNSSLLVYVHVENDLALQDFL